MTTPIECPDCGEVIVPERPLPAGSLIGCPHCEAQSLTAEPDPPPLAREPDPSVGASNAQILGIFAAIGLGLMIAYGLGKADVLKPADLNAADERRPLDFQPVLQPVPNGSNSPEAVQQAMRTATDPAIRLGLVEARRVVFRESPVTQDCRRLLDPVSSAYRIRQADAARRIIEVVGETEQEGDRFSPLQVLDAADLYAHSPRYQGGRNDFDAFLASFREVRQMGNDRSAIPDRMVHLR